MSVSRFLLACSLFPAAPAVALVPAGGGGPVLYVDEDATGLGDGTSWADAFVHLQDALGAAPTGAELRIAEGVYRPDEGALATPGDRDARFVIADDLTLVGGFVGGGALDPDVRNPRALLTILCGDLAGDDEPDFAQRGDNSRLLLEHTAGALVLDGLVVRGGNNDLDAGADEQSLSGSGVYVGSAAQSLTIRDCVLEEHLSLGGNLALGGGGAVSVWDLAADLVIEDSVLRGNAVRNTVGRAAFGGALHADQVLGEVRLSNVRFEANEITISGGSFFTRARGGAAYLAVGPAMARVEDVVFAQNVAECDTGAEGGGLDAPDAVVVRATFEGNVVRATGGDAIGGGLSGGSFVADSRFIGNRAESDVEGSAGGMVVGVVTTVSGCLFAGNSATHSPGALRVDWFGDCEVRGCTIADNSAEGELSTRSVGGVQDETLLATGFDALENCILWGNTDQGGTSVGDAQLFVQPTTPVNSCTIEDLPISIVGTGNGSADPGFLDALGADGLAGTPDDDHRLGTGSADVDTGDDLAVAADGADSDGDMDVLEPAPFDLVGAARVSDGDADTTAIVDRGALEAPTPEVDIDLDAAEVLVLVPGGGLGDPLADVVLDVTSLALTDDETVRASEAPAVPMSLGLAGTVLGRVARFESSLADGEFAVTVSVPFTSTDLAGADPLDPQRPLELRSYDPSTGEWALAVERNLATSPGQTGPVGDYFLDTGPVPPVTSTELGDHGCYWDDVAGVGFVWARLDHAGDYAPLLFTDCNANGLADGGELAAGTSLDLDEEGTPDECQDLSLRGDVAGISLSAGGRQELTIEAGPPIVDPLRFVLVLSSASGTSPGTPVELVVLPLALDPLVTKSVQLANSALYQDTFAALPPDGGAEAAIVFPAGGLSPSLAGTVIHHAYITLESQLGVIQVPFASNAVRMEILP